LVSDVRELGGRQIGADRLPIQRDIYILIGTNIYLPGRHGHRFDCRFHLGLTGLASLADEALRVSRLLA